MTEGRLPKIALKWMPKQKRARGRPKKNWTKGMKKAMNERNLNEGQWEDMKQLSLGVGHRRKTFWTRHIHAYTIVNNNVVVAQTSEVGTTIATLQKWLWWQQENSKDVSMGLINSNGNSGCKVQRERLDTEYTPVVTTLHSFYVKRLLCRVSGHGSFIAKKASIFRAMPWRLAFSETVRYRASITTVINRQYSVRTCNLEYNN